MTQTPPPDAVVVSDADDMFVFKPHHLTQVMVAGMAAIFCAGFWYAGIALGWPAELYFRGSLAQPPVA
ncbi:MAG TPA: hypothetical protein VFC78_15760, partial [Tepidisphaeraceae bacterium]|nr:hypothetical protein [Tepidisphaeraceae bacterium]